MASKTTNYNLDMPAYNEIADIDVINGNMDKIDVQMKKNADSAQQSKDIVSDEYSETSTYAVGDYCIHENILYKCKTAITTGEAFDSNKWVQTTCGTEFRGLNSNLDKNHMIISKSHIFSGTKKSYTIKNLTSDSQDFIITSIYRNTGAASECDGNIVIHKETTSGIKVIKTFGASEVSVTYDSALNEINITTTKGYMTFIIQSNKNYIME